MAILTKHVDQLYPEDSYWYDSEFDYFVEDLKTRGINVEEEVRGRRKDGSSIMEPSISFSGFWSQGDGLAFDCHISWPEFFVAHPDFAEALPVWYILLVSNPTYFNAGTQRRSRGNNMSSFVEDDYPDIVEHGYFAGTDMEEMLGLKLHDLEKYIGDVCEAEADKMYRSLKKTYNAECEYLREQEIENIKEENMDRLQEVMSLLPKEGNKSIFEEVLDDADDVDFEDFEVLGLVKHKERGMYEKCL